MTSREPSILGKYYCTLLLFFTFIVYCQLTASVESASAFAEDPFLRRESDNRESNDIVSPIDKNAIPAHSGKPAESEENAAQGNEDENQSESYGAAPSKQSKKASPFIGYGAYRELLVAYCKALIADGHHARVQNILDKLLKEKAECASCRQLYRALSCKLSTKQLEAIAPSAVAEPSTELLAAISEVFSDIAENPEFAAITAQNLEPILKELSIDTDPISTSYFGIFISYIRSALESELASAEKTEERKEKKLKQKELESMF